MKDDNVKRMRSNRVWLAAGSCELDEFMLSRPAIVVNCFSSGVATADAIVSGEAPGRVAAT